MLVAPSVASAARPVERRSASLEESGPASAEQSGRRRGAKHRPGCKSRRCDRRVDRHWARTHRPKVRLRPFDICVANNETGEPGSSNPAFIRWDANDGTYSGAFQFDAATWAEAGGTRYSSIAGDATKAQQLRIFHAFEPGNEGRWPNTIPPCL